MSELKIVIWWVWPPAIDEVTVILPVADDEPQLEKKTEIITIIAAKAELISLDFPRLICVTFYSFDHYQLLLALFINLSGQIAKSMVVFLDI